MNKILKRIKYLTLVLVIYPFSVFAADSIFTDDEEAELVKQESSFLGGLLGSDQLPLNKSGKWQKFKPVEAYGAGSESIPTQDPNELYQQEKATRQYLQARDPFSNYERIENVRETLSPKPQ